MKTKYEMILEDYLKLAHRDLGRGHATPEEIRENVIMLTDKIIGIDTDELREDLRDLAAAGYITLFEDEKGREMVELTNKGSDTLEEK